MPHPQPKEQVPIQHKWMPRFFSSAPDEETVVPAPKEQPISPPYRPLGGIVVTGTVILVSIIIKSFHRQRYLKNRLVETKKDLRETKSTVRVLRKELKSAKVEVVNATKDVEAVIEELEYVTAELEICRGALGFTRSKKLMVSKDTLPGRKAISQRISDSWTNNPRANNINVGISSGNLKL